MQEEQPHIKCHFLKQQSKHQAEEETWGRCKRRADPRHHYSQDREDPEVQHRVGGDEAESRLGELAIQQNAGEQRGCSEWMTSHGIRDEEPQHDNESSEESTDHTVDDYCLCGSPHVRPREKGLLTTWRRWERLSTGGADSALRPRRALPLASRAAYSLRPASSRPFPPSRAAAAQRSNRATSRRPPGPRELR